MQGALMMAIKAGVRGVLDLSIVPNAPQVGLIVIIAGFDLNLICRVIPVRKLYAASCEVRYSFQGVVGSSGPESVIS